MGGANPNIQATHLNPSQESQFQKWKSVNAPQDSGKDYDLRGAFLADVKPDPVRHHMTDEYKMPNHPTFSIGSKYSTPQQMGGEWSTTPQGKDTYELIATMQAVFEANRPRMKRELFQKGFKVISHGFRTGKQMCIIDG